MGENGGVDVNDKTIKGTYFRGEDTAFPDPLYLQTLKSKISTLPQLIDKKIEDKSLKPPKLYNLNALQKDAFTTFRYTAEKTLSIIQSLYEELKCVSYPRTPSRVMGSGNVDLCASTYATLINAYSKYAALKGIATIDLSNKQCFNDKKLESHHCPFIRALIVNVGISLFTSVALYVSNTKSIICVKLSARFWAICALKSIMPYLLQEYLLA